MYYHSQCLEYALDKWTTEGGYLMFGKSSHWCLPHVLHLDSTKTQITHFVPDANLDMPWYSLFGFVGRIRLDDPVIRQPIHPLGILVGCIVLFVLGGVWMFKRTFIKKSSNGGVV